MNQGVFPALLVCLLVVVSLTQAKPTECKDKLPNCKDYARSSCTGKYKPWSLKNCRLTCGLCDEEEDQQFECKDYHANCNYYLNKDFWCDMDNYKRETDYKDGNKWAIANCRKSCGLCDPNLTNSSTDIIHPLYEGNKTCKDGGSVYEIGVNYYYTCWDCKCHYDGQLCLDIKCQKFDLPKPTCYWMSNPDNKKCCNVPVCPDGTVIEFPYWYIDH